MLHITSDLTTADTLSRAGMPGTVVAWSDVLHEGAVPQGLPLAELSAIRARFIADAGWADYETTRNAFAARDAALYTALARNEEILLWFAHDLVDQLQLIQILGIIATTPTCVPRARLIPVQVAPETGMPRRFCDLSRVDIQSLGEARVPVTEGVLSIAAAAWSAFTSPDPRALAEITRSMPPGLPALAPAIQRHLEQFPWVHDGLNRSERMILRALLSGPQRPEGLFRAQQDAEAIPFMGPRVFWWYVARLGSGLLPLLRRCDAQPLTVGAPPPNDFVSCKLELTEHGRHVLTGKTDAIRHVLRQPDHDGILRSRTLGISRWLGGVHLRGGDAPWRWHERRREMVPQSATGPTLTSQRHVRSQRSAASALQLSGQSTQPSKSSSGPETSKEREMLDARH